jgi:hypothetical protein
MYKLYIGFVLNKLSYITKNLYKKNKKDSTLYAKDDMDS